MTVREQVLAAFKARLDGISVPNLLVERNRDIPVEHYPSVVMVDGGQSPDVDQPGVKIVRMRVDVEMYVKANTYGELAGAFDALYGSVVRAVMADRTLGDLAVDIDEGELQDPLTGREEGVGPTQATSLAFEVEYWVDPDDPDTLAS